MSRKDYKAGDSDEVDLGKRYKKGAIFDFHSTFPITSNLNNSTMFSKTLIAASAIALGASSALAAHTIQVNNNCGEQFVMQVPGHDNVYSGGGGTYSYDGDVNG